MTTVAGKPGVRGNAEGVGNEARFWEPSGIAVDANGRVYIAEAFDHTIWLGKVKAGSSPALAIARAADEVILSWPDSAADFQLERKSLTSPSGGWNPVAPNPVEEANHFIHTNLISEPALIYRLRKP